MKRGEIWTVAGGSDYTGKPRPAVIVQDDRYDSTNSVTICPLTLETQSHKLDRSSDACIAIREELGVAGPAHRYLHASTCQGRTAHMRSPTKCRTVSSCIQHRRWRCSMFVEAKACSSRQDFRCSTDCRSFAARRSNTGN